MCFSPSFLRQAEDQTGSHRHEHRPQGDLATRKKERAALNVLATCRKPYLGGLSRERMKELQRILRNPDPLPITPADVVADRQRREAAMAEINVSQFSQPDFNRFTLYSGPNIFWSSRKQSASYHHRVNEQFLHSKATKKIGTRSTSSTTSEKMLQA